MSDLISRADAIKAIRKCKFESVMSLDWYRGMECAQDIVKDVPSAELPKGDLISRADAIEAVTEILFNEPPYLDSESLCRMYAEEKINALPSADAEPKWNCTANFVAEQLDCLRKMTDEEKWEFFRKFFGMGDAVQGEWKQEYRKTANGVDFCVIACSECDYYDAQMHYYNYCPMCGARMKGGGE